MGKGIEIKKIKINMETKSPLHIGGKEDRVVGIHNPITKYNNKAVIPGPSIKGAFRASLEKLLIINYAESNSEMKPCIPATKNTLSKEERNEVEKNNRMFRGSACYYGYKFKTHEPAPICPVCYLLGSQSLDGFVFMPFLEMEQEVHPYEFYSIRLDRIIGTGVDKSNREYEFIPDGVVFSGIMEVTLINNFRGWKLGKPRQLALNTNNNKVDKWLQNQTWNDNDVINNLIKPGLENIVQVGGFRSKGFGKIKVTVDDLGNDEYNWSLSSL